MFGYRTRKATQGGVGNVESALLFTFYQDSLDPELHQLVPALVLPHRKPMHPPDGRPAGDIDYLRLPVSLKKLRGLHTSMPALTDEQDFTIPWHLIHPLLKLAEGNIFGIPGMSLRIFPCLSH